MADDKKKTLSLGGKTTSDDTGDTQAPKKKAGGTLSARARLSAKAQPKSHTVVVEVKRRNVHRNSSLKKDGKASTVDERRLRALKAREKAEQEEKDKKWMAGPQEAEMKEVAAPVEEEKNEPQPEAPAEPDTKEIGPTRGFVRPQVVERKVADPIPEPIKEEPKKRQQNFSKPVAPKIKDAEEEKKPKLSVPRSGLSDRRRGKITVSQALSGKVDAERTRSTASFRRKIKKMSGNEVERAKVTREVKLPDFITVQELASRMSERSTDVIKKLMELGMIVTVTQTIDAETAQLIIEEMGHKFKRVSDSDVEDVIAIEDDTDAKMTPRAPVVTVMGHVDHGKTSLLDALRGANVVSGEAGGITQHIGAYQVTTKSKKKISFIDTPGHAAFTEMRARGAKTTDIVVLVVAADDGIMPQTIEAINHARAAEVPLIVAINKMDLPAANPQIIKNDLLQHEVVIEDMGGDVMAVEISAKDGTNLDKLEEAILLQAEIMELSSNIKARARGAVVETQVDKGRGSVATVLVQRGELKVGDLFVVGATWGKVRALVNDKGKRVKKAGPSEPVEILGLNDTPMAGDELVVVDNETDAREIVDYRQRKAIEAENARRAKATGGVDALFAQVKEGEKKSLNVIIKGDVHGSIEALQSSLEKLDGETEDVNLKIAHTAVGPINESDVTLANATNALIIGFNVRANSQARDLAHRDQIEIRYYSIIYNALDDMRGLLSGLLEPETKENFIGYAKIQQVFNITKVGKVAGCVVTEGRVKRGASVRLLRDDVVIHEGTLKTLKRVKDEVKEVTSGMECGMAFDNYDDIREGDMIEAFEVEKIERSL